MKDADGTLRIDTGTIETCYLDCLKMVALRLQFQGFIVHAIDRGPGGALLLRRRQSGAFAARLSPA
jgi:hypothetical protein